MSEDIDFMVAQSFELLGNIDLTATDSLGAGRTCNVQAAAAWYRIFLANSATGDGSESAPLELLNVLEAALGGVWEIRMTVGGFITIRYTGTGNGTLTLPTAIANLLGFGTTVGPLAAASVTTGTYQPTHCVFSLNFGEDNGWQRVRPKVAAQTLPSGQTYAFSDHQPGATRLVTLQFHPKDQAQKDEGLGVTMTGTAMFPPDGRFLNSWLGEPAQEPPWSVWDFVNTITDQTLGVAFGNFRDLVAGTAGATFDVCCLTAECLNSGGNDFPSRPNDDRRYDMSGIEFRLVQKGDTR
jgi:hypothetical protein